MCPSLVKRGIGFKFTSSNWERPLRRLCLSCSQATLTRRLTPSRVLQVNGSVVFQVYFDQCTELDFMGTSAGHLEMHNPGRRLPRPHYPCLSVKVQRR